MPIEWWIGRICEEFHCLPSEAWREWQLTPVGWIERVMEARAYAATKRLRDAAKDEKHMPTGPMSDRVKQIQFAIVREEIAANQLGVAE